MLSIAYDDEAADVLFDEDEIDADRGYLALDERLRSVRAAHATKMQM